jgi:hypothetical protein
VRLRIGSLPQCSLGYRTFGLALQDSLHVVHGGVHLGERRAGRRRGVHVDARGVDNYPILTFGKAGGLRKNYFYESVTAENACLVPYTLAATVGANLGRSATEPAGDRTAHCFAEPLLTTVPSNHGEVARLPAGQIASYRIDLSKLRALTGAEVRDLARRARG